MVADMVDFFLVLMLPGAGDELQGIKKGILELADMVAVNKADVFESKLKQAVNGYKSALHIMSDASPDWHPPVVTCSGLTGFGLPELWERIEKHRRIMDANGNRATRRQDQRLMWLQHQVRDRLLNDFYANQAVAEKLSEVQQDIRDGKTTVSTGVNQLLDSFKKSKA